MVVRMRHNRSQTAQRRSHHALKAQGMLVCECGATRLSHRACPTCGRYRGRVVVDLAGKSATRLVRRQKKAAADGREVGNKSEATKK